MLKKHLYLSILLACSSTSAIASHQQFIQRPVLKSSYAPSTPIRALNRFESKLESKQVWSALKNKSIKHIVLPLAAAELRIRIQNQVSQPNGDITVIGQVLKDEADHRVIATYGPSGAIVDIRGPHLNYRGILSGKQYELTQLDHPTMQAFPTPNDAVESLHQFSPELVSKLESAQTKSAVSNELVVVDAYLLYTPNIANRYPGDLSETLMNQLMATTNQAFVDSGTNVYLRLVGTDLVNYTKPSDFSALEDLDSALRGFQSDVSLNNVLAKRDQLGADLVAMIRTHDLNEREVCGVARFPTTDHDILINISNVGMSGGSYCYDTFTHEVGHNFGAGHQWRNGQSVGFHSFSGAWIVEGKWNTIMSSIGTGDVNRNYGLNKFSNPDIICGGLPCGDSVMADNARTIDLLAEQNASLRPSISTVEVNPYQISEADTDGDGVIDNEDAYPFDPNESADTDGDGYGDNSDAFPEDGNEWFDTDQDGIGNNADTDDDNDGVADNLDQLPLDPNETVDADGDGIGANADALDNNRFEYQDSDNDGQGNRRDTDDDNDGVADWAQPTSLDNTEMFVISAENNRLLQFDLSNQDVTTINETGEGGYNFRSAMAVSPSGELYVIDYSDVARYDRLANKYEVVIDRADITTNFPVHMVFDSDFDLILNSGLGASTIAKYTLGQEWDSAASATEAVLRGMVLVDDNTMRVTARSTNQVIEYNLSSMQQSAIFIDQADLNKPEHMLILSNGKYLISQAGDNTIRQYSSSGNAEGIFIQAGSGGLGLIGCMAQGPDGHIYVCSQDTDQVLKFNGTSGAFIEEVMSADDGLDKPMSLVFAGALLDTEPFNPNNDSDGDGTANINDELPLDPNETVDTDNDGVGNNADTDDDNDGMPDTFESENGFDPLDPSDANQDADNDGRTNLQEYQDQTDPNDASSVKKKKSGGGSTQWFILSVLALIGLARRRFRLENQSY